MDPLDRDPTIAHLPAVMDDTTPPPLSPIPEDLVQWWNGKTILAERHNLRRIQTRWRVVEVYAFLGEDDDPWVVKGEWREFKTHDGAIAYQNRLAKQGRVVLIQPGIVFWPDPDEWPKVWG